MSESVSIQIVNHDPVPYESAPSESDFFRYLWGDGDVTKAREFAFWIMYGEQDQQGYL